jgi:transcriptional regulator with XRE-family HTH domain
MTLCTITGVDAHISYAYSVGMSAVAQKVAKANQSETARELGLSRAYLSRMLRGERRVTLKVGVELSKRLGVSAEELSEYLEGVGAVGVVN